MTRDKALRRFPIQNDWERAQAAQFEMDLANTTDHVPGWMAEESGLKDVIDLIDDAIMAYDEEQTRRDEDLLDATEEEEKEYALFHGRNPDEAHVPDIDPSTP